MPGGGKGSETQRRTQPRPPEESARLRQGAGDPAAQGRLHLAQAHSRLAPWTLFNLSPVLEHSSGQLVKCPTAAFH